MRFLRYVLCLLLVSILFVATVKAGELEEIKAQIRKLQERVEQLEAERKPEPIPPKSQDSDNSIEDASGEKTPKPLNIFGKSVKLTFYGTLQTDVMHDFQTLGLGDSFINEFITGEIPVRGSEAAQKDNRTGFSVNQSNVNLGLETPTDYGSMKVFTEINLAKNISGGPAFQLYQGYGALGPFLAGKAWSTFTDTSAIPDTLDYEGPQAIPEVRHVMLRWTQPLPRDLSLIFALEEPVAELTLPAGASAVNRVPDVITRLQFEPPWATLNASGLYRRLHGEGGGFDASANGWGLQLGGNIDAFGRDSFQFGALYGHGLGHYIQDTQGYGLDAAPSAPGASDLEAIPAFSGWVGYQHWWTETLRSTATYGYVRLWNNAGQPADTYKRTTYVSANIIWSPWRPVDMGFEYLYGERQTKSAGDGRNSRLQFSVKFNFGK